VEGVMRNIKLRHSAYCYLADKEYGTKLSETMNLDFNEAIQLSKMTRAERMKATSLPVAPKTALDSGV
jgi:catalase